MGGEHWPGPLRSAPPGHGSTRDGLSRSSGSTWKAGWLVIGLLVVEMHRGDLAYKTIWRIHAGFSCDTASRRRGLLSPHSGASWVLTIPSPEQAESINPRMSCERLRRVEKLCSLTRACISIYPPVSAWLRDARLVSWQSSLWDYEQEPYRLYTEHYYTAIKKDATVLFVTTRMDREGSVLMK